MSSCAKTKLVGDVLLTLEKPGLSARDASTGEVLWEQPAAASDCDVARNAILELGEVLSVATLQRVLLVDAASGEPEGSIELGETVAAQFGPPFIVQTVDDRIFKFGYWSGPLAAASYFVVVRKLGGRWIVRQIVLDWIA